MNWCLKFLRQYTDFDGRARRTEYWMFALINLLVIVIFSVIDYTLGFLITSEIPNDYLTILYSLVVFIPGIAVAIRRLQGLGKNGWYLVTYIISN